MFVIDEAGFGTIYLRKYAYSKIGEPNVYIFPHKLAANLTCTATISPLGTEYLRFFSGGGTVEPYFIEYFSDLVNKMRIKYPHKKLVFLLDNLPSHKSLEILKIV